MRMPVAIILPRSDLAPTEPFEISGTICAVDARPVRFAGVVPSRGEAVFDAVDDLLVAEDQ